MGMMGDCDSALLEEATKATTYRSDLNSQFLVRILFYRRIHGPFMSYFVLYSDVWRMMIYGWYILLNPPDTFRDLGSPITFLHVPASPIGDLVFKRVCYGIV